LAAACSLVLTYALVVSPATAQTATQAPAPAPHVHGKVAAPAPSGKQPAKPKTKLKLTKGDTIIYVGDLHCQHCAKSLASKLYTVKGVVKVRTDLKADVAIITPQAKKKLDPVELWKAAGKSGFPAVKLVGPAGTYVADAKTKAPKLVPVKRETAVKKAVAKS